MLTVFGIFFEHPPKIVQEQTDQQQVPAQQDQQQVPAQPLKLQPGQYPPRSDVEPEEIPPEESPEMVPLKRYYLQMRLQDLKAKILRAGMKNDDLDLVLRFGDVFSYPVFLNLSNKLLKSVDTDIQNYTKMLSAESKRIIAASKKVKAREQKSEEPEIGILTPNESVPFN
jgi:hypothetical protein